MSTGTLILSRLAAPVAGRLPRVAPAIEVPAVYSEKVSIRTVVTLDPAVSGSPSERMRRGSICGGDESGSLVQIDCGDLVREEGG